MKGLQQGHKDVGSKDVEKCTVDEFKLLILDVDDRKENHRGVDER